MDQANKRCLFVLAEKGKTAVHSILKPLKPVYNGVGWYIEDKFEDQIRHFCSESQMKIIEFPLAEETFEELRKRHKTSFFNEREIKLRLQIDNLKHELKISSLDNTAITSPTYRDALQLSSQGIRLIELLDEHKRLHDHLRNMKEEERLAKLTLDSSSTFHHLLQPANEAQIIDELRQTSRGLSVGYKISNVDLKIPGGALTILAGPTAHGKTAVSINFCLGALSQEQNKNSCVYFFSYEESRAAIVSLFLNAYIGNELSMNNRETIKNCLRDSQVPSISPESQRNFLQMKTEFFSQLIEKGLLNVFYTDMNTSELVAAIRYLKKKTNVGLICIDYMQLLKMGEGCYGSRQEELKEICLLLKDCAVETGLPILLGAQFNRTVLAEADLWPTNIGEAGDIERIANTIIGFWNRHFDGSREGNKGKDGRPVPKEKAIYFEILKSRQFGNGHSEVMDFDGNTGKLRNRLSAPSNHSLFG